MVGQPNAKQTTINVVAQVTYPGSKKAVIIEIFSKQVLAKLPTLRSAEKLLEDHRRHFEYVARSKLRTKYKRSVDTY